MKHRLVNTRVWGSLCWLVIFLCGLWDWAHLRFFAWRHSRLASRSDRPSTTPGPHARPRIAFVLTWYGKDIAGGAESAAYGLIQSLRQYEPGMDVEVLATTLKEFPADWNQPYHREGMALEDGVVVRRFHPLRIGRTFFHFLNSRYLMTGGVQALWDHKKRRRVSPIPAWAEAYFLKRMVVSPHLIQYIAQHRAHYDAFIFMPYMFANTVLGSIAAGSKAAVIPCLHDERYAYMNVYEQAFAQAGAILCNVRSEAALIRKLYPKVPDPQMIGIQVDADVPAGDPERFRAKYGIRGPFVLYAGRMIVGKNLPLLVEYFQTFRTLHPAYAHVQLVLIGKGDLDFTLEPGVRTLGFVSPADKADAYAAATCLGMLSTNESFSIVMMESWLQKTPVIVSGDCEVTYDHVIDSGGGFAVKSPETFASSLLSLLQDPDQRDKMGSKGRTYVLANYTPEQVTRRFKAALQPTCRMS